MAWNYVLMMKGMRAEYAALVSAGRDPDVVTPIIRLVDRPPLDAGEEDAPGPGGAVQPMWEPQSAVSRRLVRGLLGPMAAVWDHDVPVRLDGSWLEPGEFSAVLDDCRSFGRPVSPVVSLGHPLHRLEAAAAATAWSGCGFVLRLAPADFRAGKVASRVRDLCSSLEAKPHDVDVVLDLGAMSERHWGADAVLARSMVEALPTRDEWRNFALTGSSTPAHARAPEFPPDDIRWLVRSEWWTWLALKAAGGVGRMPVFGDYGVIHPDRVEAIAEPKRLIRIPQIRYTWADGTWLIRGTDLDGGPDDTRRLLRQFCDDPLGWSGPDMSWGDAWMLQAATGSDSLGSFETWRRVGQTHHIAYVTQQLATPPWH